MRRLFIAVLIVTAMFAAGSATVSAAPSGFGGRWVAIDADLSTWRITINGSNQYHGIDSATIPGGGARTRTWGQMTPVGENTMEADINLQFMVPGPPVRLYLPGPFVYEYDPLTDTISLDQGTANDIAVFCRVPCDPELFGPLPHP